MLLSISSCIDPRVSICDLTAMIFINTTGMDRFYLTLVAQSLHLPAHQSVPVMWWNECFVHQLSPAAKIDGACNWWLLCVIAKINRHCQQHGRSMSCTKQERERGRNNRPSYSLDEVVAIFSHALVTVMHLSLCLITSNDLLFRSFNLSNGKWNSVLKRLNEKVLNGKRLYTSLAVSS